MFAQGVLFQFTALASLLLMASCSQAENAEMPPVVKALEEQGLIVKNEFQVEGGCALSPVLPVTDQSLSTFWLMAMQLWVHA